MSAQTDLEDELEFQMKTSRIVNARTWDVEVVFHPTRQWRFDFAFLEEMIAVEVEGGTWAKSDDGHPVSRHTSPAGFEEDCEKYDEAAILGWRVLRFTGHMVKDGRALVLLERALRSVGSGLDERGTHAREAAVRQV